MWNVRLVAGRRCGSCTLCCKLLEIAELEKPVNRWCDLCDVGKGCRAYDDRPRSCRSFHCGYLMLPQLDAAWHPSAAKLIVCLDPDVKKIFIVVNPDRPQAWRREPFYSRVKLWARDATQAGGQVIVCLGQRQIVVLPDCDVDVGIVKPDEIVVTERYRSPHGMELRAFKMNRSDPRMHELVPLSAGRPLTLA